MSLCLEKSLDKLTILSFSIGFIFFNPHFLLNNDVYWLIEVGERWLHGGQYIKDYFETNPPLAFYIYLPIYFINHYLAINIKA